MGSGDTDDTPEYRHKTQVNTLARNRHRNYRDEPF